MKINFFVILAALVVLLVAGNAQTENTPQANGRFQLFVGSHAVNGTMPVSDILRIDTETGQTSMWMEGVGSNGALISRWSAISEK